jgi:septal ring factor EnvC (AmiA/AmiB activator)
MKCAVYLIILSVILISTANAQPRFSAKDRLEILKERLSLTQEQSAKVEKILLKQEDEMKKLRSSDNFDRTEFRKVMDNSNQEIEKVLDKKQKLEFKKMLDERRQRRQENSSRSVE